MNFNVIFNFCPKYYLKFLFSNSLIQKMTKLPLWRLKHLVMSGVGISTTEISFRVRKYHEKFSSWLPSSLLESPQTVLGPNTLCTFQTSKFSRIFMMTWNKDLSFYKQCSSCFVAILKIVHLFICDFTR